MPYSSDRQRGRVKPVDLVGTRRGVQRGEFGRLSARVRVRAFEAAPFMVHRPLPVRAREPSCAGPVGPLHCVLIPCNIAKLRDCPRTYQLPLVQPHEYYTAGDNPK